MLLLLLNSVTVDFDKVHVSRVSRVNKSLVYEISRSFLSCSTLSVKRKKKKRKKTFSRSVVKLTRLEIS